MNSFGVRKCNLANGGSGRVAFSDKLISVGWVISVRGAFILLLLLLAGSTLLLGIVGGVLGIGEAGFEVYGELLGSVVMLIYLAWVWLKASSHTLQLR